MLHHELWTANLDLATACLEHPFVQGLGRGTLPDEAFERYVAQDAFYLKAFAQAYALAAARCDDVSRMVAYHELIGGALEEIRMHTRHAAERGIELDGVRPVSATTAYTDFLLHNAWHRDEPVILAGMVPCMRLYAWIGRRLADAFPPGPAHPYREWIGSYSSDEFERLAARLEAMLDEVAEDGPEIRNPYRRAMRCEYAFFDAQGV